MRHAFIITAYKDFEFIKKTVEVYLQKADCYIHIDKKVSIPEEFMEWAKDLGGYTSSPNIKLTGAVTSI